MKTLEPIAQAWLFAKQCEANAVAERRRIEDQMLDMMEVSEQMEGVKNIDAGHCKIKLTGRMNRKVDPEKLQEIAAENGLSDLLGVLFRWKPEIVAAKWKGADESITSALSGAITTKPGRVSFSITTEE